VAGHEPGVEPVCDEGEQDHGGEAAIGHDGVRDEHSLSDGLLIVVGQFSDAGEDSEEDAEGVPGA
jgi:hypothetical protein